MALEDILVFRARSISASTRGLDAAEMVDGDFGVKERRGPWFDCMVFLPTGTEDSTRRGRSVREPTLLFGESDENGDVIALKPKMSLEVVAPSQNVLEGRLPDATQRWDVIGRPQPFGAPGDETIGGQVTIRQVED